MANAGRRSKVWRREKLAGTNCYSGAVKSNLSMSAGAGVLCASQPRREGGFPYREEEVRIDPRPGERGERIPAPSPRAAPSSAATRAVGAEARRRSGWTEGGGRGVIGAGEGGGRWWVGESVRVDDSDWATFLRQVTA